MSDEERDESNEHNSPSASDLLRWAGKTQRTIDFMVQQQVQFQTKSETDMQRLRELYERNEERWAGNEERWSRANERWERTEESVRSLHAIAQIHEGEIMAIVEAHADTRGRLDALIDTVERLISERRNGGRGKREESSG
jgi:transcriptional regulator with XRE-family HTH domain